MSLAAQGARGWSEGNALPLVTAWTRALAPEAKLLTALAMVVCTVALPAHTVGGYLAMALVAAVLALASGASGAALRTVLALELPFALFAVMVPFVAGGERVELLGLSLSLPGLWSAWSLVAKAAVGALTAVSLAASTTAHEMVEALERLHLPAQLVSIMSFMVRYAEVVADQWRRMTIARSARGFEARGPRDWLVLARSLGALFVACYERGERVHLAMLSRGHQGVMPHFAGRPRPSARPLALVALLPVVVLLVCRVAA